MPVVTQDIVPCLWFNRQPEEAARLYVSILGNSRMGGVMRSTGAGVEVHGIAEGTVVRRGAT